MKLYQPIIDLAAGQLIGIEASTRRADDSHGAYLRHASSFDGEARLFLDDLFHGLETLSSIRLLPHPQISLFLSIKCRTILGSDVLTDLISMLKAALIPPHLINLQVSDTDGFLRLQGTQEKISAMRANGVRLVLEEVGTGSVPILSPSKNSADIIKINGQTIRDIENNCENLHLLIALNSFARTCRSNLILPGVDTPAVLEAVNILGITKLQGKAIAGEMPEKMLLDWIASTPVKTISRVPSCLLGAYAAHLSIVEACRALYNQPLKVNWSEEARDPHACSIGKFFDKERLHDTMLGVAHKRFHTMIDKHDSDPEGWEAVSTELWLALEESIAAERANKTRLALG